MADKLIPIVTKIGSRQRASTELGVKEYVIEGICHRLSSVSMPKPQFDKLVELLGLDVSKWDLSRY